MTVETLFREEWGRAVSILIRVLGDFELAEDAVQDAFATAVEKWPRDGTPRNPSAWIVTTARNRAIDRIRRERTLARKTELLARLEELRTEEEDDVSSIPDERLSLVFTCCHPALAPEARVALTLHEVGGLRRPRSPARSSSRRRRSRSASFARSGRSVTRASRSASRPTTSCRSACARCSPSSTSSSTRATPRRPETSCVRRDLCDEATRLAKLLAVLMPDEPEVLGLLALILLQDSRREARVGHEGDLILLEEQDRSKWDNAKIDEGVRMLDRAMARRRPGPYQLQAAIAALHAQAPSADDTDWQQIASLYGLLEELTGSPVVGLNKAVAMAMAGGPDAGLDAIDQLSGLEAYHLFHATRADLLRRLERAEEAAVAYRRALELATNPIEKRYLERRLREVA